MDAGDSVVCSNVVTSMTGAVYSKYQYAPIIELQYKVWEDFKDYEGKVEYYFFGRKLGHGGLCFRIPNTDTIAQAELVVSKRKEYNQEMRWYILVKKSKKWIPNSEDEVQVSEHAWHAGTVLHMGHNFAKVLKKYHMFFNNCNTWKRNVVAYMRDEGPPENITKPSCLDDLMKQCKEEGVSLTVVQDADVE